jgi:MFS superfamily sulfate permease-like transporter
MLAGGGVVYLYFVAPLSGGWTGHTALLLGIGLVAVALLVGWQTWAIARSPYPRLRAAAVLALSFPPLVLLFAGTYVVLARDRPDSFTQPLNRVDGLYFSVTVFATVGFGDIVARTAEARLLVTGQMLCDLLYVGLVVRSLVTAAQIGLRHNADDASGGAPEAGQRPKWMVNRPVRAPGRRRPDS